VQNNVLLAVQAPANDQEQEQEPEENDLPAQAQSTGDEDLDMYSFPSTPSPSPPSPSLPSAPLSGPHSASEAQELIESVSSTLDNPQEDISAEETSTQGVSSAEPVASEEEEDFSPIFEVAQVQAAGIRAFGFHYRHTACRGSDC